MDFPESDARVPLEFLGRGLRLFLIVGGAGITAFFVLGGVLAAFHRLSPGDGNGVGGAIGYPTFGGLFGLLCWYLLRYRSGEILLSDESPSRFVTPPSKIRSSSPDPTSSTSSVGDSVSRSGPLRLARQLWTRR